MRADAKGVCVRTPVRNYTNKMENGTCELDEIYDYGLHVGELVPRSFSPKIAVKSRLFGCIMY